MFGRGIEVAVFDGVGEALPVGVGVGSPVGVGVAVGLTFGVGVTEGDAVGVGSTACAAEPRPARTSPTEITKEKSWFRELEIFSRLGLFTT
jgi:hypothetical protein